MISDEQQTKRIKNCDIKVLELKNELLDMLSVKDEQISRMDEQIKFLMDLTKTKDKEISRLRAIIGGRRIHNARMININTYNQQ